VSASKAKGSAAERDLVTFLRTAGFPHAERRLAGSAQDRGDIAGMPGVVVEVKNHASLNLAGWVDEALVEQGNDGADYGIVVHKRRGKGSAGDWYATCTVAQIARLLRQAGYGEPLDGAS
jgi:hypothetical protein